MKKQWLAFILTICALIVPRKLWVHWQEKNWQFALIWVFPPGNSDRIHGWLWNEKHSLSRHWRGSLLFFKVFRQSLWSHGPKNRRFESDLGEITRPVAAIKFLRFGVLVWSLSCSLSNWWMHFLGLPCCRTFSSRAISCWYGSGNFNLKGDSSAKLSFEAQSIFDVLTW